MGLICGVVPAERIDNHHVIDCMTRSMKNRFAGDCKIKASQNCSFSAGGRGNDYLIIECREQQIIVSSEGEIYNTHELLDQFFQDKKQLYEENCFSIVPLLYEKFGIDFPRYLNGVFAIALWDDKKKTLYLCRDDVGSHALYYSSTAQGVFFSSTVKALIETSLVPPTLSAQAVNQYFSSKALSPPATMYAAVSSVRAGYIISIHDENIIEHDFWKLHEIDVDMSVSEEDYVAQVQNLILDAIKIRADYGGKYSAIVSGGLDTGINVSTLARSLEPEKLHTLSVSFEEVSFSDAPLQKLMVDQFGTKHHELQLSSVDFSETLSSAVGFLDSPVNDIAFVGMAKVFEMAKNYGFEVVFEGEGPDEIFPAGNTHGERQLSKFTRIPGFIRHNLLRPVFHTMPLGDSFVNKISRLLARLAMDDDERYLTWRTYFHNTLRKKLLTPAWYDSADPYLYQKPYLAQCENKDLLNRYQFGMIKTFLADDLLYKDERMASWKGVTNRTPLIDYRLVELALKIPSYLQLVKPSPTTDGIKLVYKKALRGHVPDAIINHKKVRGFSHPTSSWFRKELKEFVLDILLGETTKQRGMINIPYMESLVRQHLAGEANYDYPLNSLLVFELWMRSHCDSAI